MTKASPVFRSGPVGDNLFGERIALHKALYLTFAPLIIFLGDDVAHQRYAPVTDS
jgi:hypothetical protein